MHCICPMNKGRTCSDACAAAKYAKLSPTEQKVQRQTIAMQLHNDGHSQTTIAQMLGVTQGTISNDLRDLILKINIKPDRPKNPKNAGRRKGKVHRGSSQHERAREIVRPFVMANKPFTSHQLAKEHGVSNDAIDRAALAEQARKEAFEELGADPQASINGVHQAKGTMVSIHELIEKLVPLFVRVKQQSKKYVASISKSELTLIASEGRRLLDKWASDDQTIRRINGHVVSSKRPANGGSRHGSTLQAAQQHHSGLNS